MFESKNAVTALEFAAQIPDLIQSTRSGSLIEYTRSTRVEPITLIDMRAAQLPYVEDVLHTALNLFSAYYLQAVSLSVNVGNVNVLKLLDKLNPNRDPMEAGAKSAADVAKWSLSQEDFKYGLPFPGQPIGISAYSEEARDDKKGTSSSVSSGTKMVNDASNLAVGKLLEVNVESDGSKGSFPVQVRLMTNTVRPDIMTHTLALDATDTSLKERYHQWRSGQIKFFNDLVLCQDLIDQHKKNLMEDTSGYYKDRVNSKQKNRIAALLTRSPSVATASSLFVMTTDTAKELESSLKGKLTDFKTREKLFANTMGMMMFIIDPEWEQVTVYHRSIKDATETSIREIQRSNKRGGGPDISEILNAFRQNKSPIL